MGPAFVFSSQCITWLFTVFDTPLETGVYSTVLYREAPPQGKNPKQDQNRFALQNKFYVVYARTWQRIFQFQLELDFVFKLGDPQFNVSFPIARPSLFLIHDLHMARSLVTCDQAFCFVLFPPLLKKGLMTG